jgi:transposase
MKTDKMDRPAEAGSADAPSMGMGALASAPLMERRRRWTEAEKRAIAEESLVPGACPTDVARRHGIGTGQLYTWRRTCLAGPTGPAGQSFARVEVEGHGVPASVPSPRPTRDSGPTAPIEIVLVDGLLRIDPRLDIHALRRVLTALRG